MSESNWKAVSTSEATLSGETYSKIAEQIKEVNTGEIWTIQFHDSYDTWTDLEKMEVTEDGNLKAISKNAV